MKNGMVRFVSVVLTLFVAVYAGWQVYRFLFAGYKTETAAGFEVARSVTTRGILIRQEEPISQNISGVIHYLAPEGSKFVSSTPLAEIYSSQEEADTANLKSRLQEERDLIDSIRESTNVEQVQDLEILNGDITMALTQLNRCACYSDPSQAEDLRMVLTEKFTRKQLITGETTPQELEARSAQLSEQIPDLTAAPRIYSEQTGYFSRFVDNHEALFIPAMLDGLNSSTINELLSREYPYDTEAFGKSVTSFVWYYATVVPLDDAALFTSGSQVTLSFVGGNQSPVSGTVDRVTEEPENNCAVIVIRSTEISADTVSRRTASIKVGFSNYEGIRFSKKALRIVDGQKGVYIKSGYDIKFRLVDIVYTGKDFYLSRMEYNSESYLNMFEEVIVEGTNLYDGKPLQ